MASPKVSLSVFHTKYMLINVNPKNMQYSPLPSSHFIAEIPTIPNITVDMRPVIDKVDIAFARNAVG